MGTIANAKVTHYYNCYNGDFIGCLHIKELLYFIYHQVQLVLSGIRKQNIKNITHGAYRSVNGYTKFPLYLSLYILQIYLCLEQQEL